MVIRCLVFVSLAISAIAAQVSVPADLDARKLLLAKDHHSFARPESVKVTHADFHWRLDFVHQRLDGLVTWDIARVDPAATHLVLDTKALVISDVQVGRGDTWRPSAYVLGPEDPILGQSLTIALPLEHDRVRIRYHTSSRGSALQWLTPEQAGGKEPFLFSQAQAIHARTMVPCQDSPAVRFTFDAAVVAPNALRPIMAAARRGDREPGGVWRFRMPQSIPSYLLALAAGELAFAELGPRTGVWAPARLLAAAKSEFQDTEAMLTAAEALYGPYRWGRYELLVMPPSFPFGGMENPRLTFVTPTIIAGDRSLVDLVAHELAHAWSGNLVTNATWADFWLNEGFTVHFERRIMEAVYGPRRAAMEAVLGYESLMLEMADLPIEETRLHADLRGRDPDDGLTAVPYEKGALFLRTLEAAAGRERFDAFLNKWFQEQAFTSRTTMDLERALREDLLDGVSGAVVQDLDAWLYGTGIPASAAIPTSPDFDGPDQVARSFGRGEAGIGAVTGATWDTMAQLERFLSQLPKTTPHEQLAALESTFSLSTHPNLELRVSFLTLCVNAGYRAVAPRVLDLLTSVGRRKFLMPLYRGLLQDEQGALLAREAYRRARGMYHPITQASLDELLAAPR